MAAADPNIARLNGPFGEHSLGNLMNARGKAEARLARANLAATHNANRSMIAAINRHLTLRRERSRAVEANAAARRRATLAARMAAEASAPAAGAAAAGAAAGPRPGNTVGPYLSSQQIVTGHRPAGVSPLSEWHIKRRRSSSRRSSRRNTRSLRR
jgi:hypothetical protein